MTSSVTETRFPSGPSGLPFAGSILSFAKDPLRFFEKIRDEFSPISHQKVFGVHYYLLFDPEMIEHVLVRNAKNYQKNKFLKSWDRFFGQGLLTSDGEKWKRDRKLVQPLFHRDNLSAYGKLFAEQAEKRIATWKSGEVRSLNREMISLTLEIILRSMLGSSLDPETEKVMTEAFEDCTEFFEFSANPIGLFLNSFPVPVRQRYYRAIERLDEVAERIISEKRAALSSEQGPDKDLVTTLLRVQDESGSGLSNKDIRDQVMTFFLAGHETTALSLSYAIYLLALNPEKQDRLRRELSSQLGERGAQYEDLPKLGYVKNVFQEGMRLYPTSWMLGREAIEDDQIGGFHVPRGSTVVIPTWAIHRDPKIYADPEVFNPDRWTSEFRATLPRSLYLPFGYGQRMCIASLFASAEAELILAHLFRKFTVKLESSPDLRLLPSITIRPKDDILVRLS